MDDDTTIELPKTADGKPIRPGMRVWYHRGNITEHKVSSMTWRRCPEPCWQVNFAGGLNVTEMDELPENERARCHHLPPSPQRGILRSKTYPGIADAMARQWGGLGES